MTAETAHRFALPLSIETPRWTARQFQLEFNFAGRTLGSRQFRAQTWNIPLPQSLDLPMVPDWTTFPDETEIAIVQAQPIEAPLPRLTLLPDSIRYVLDSETRYYVDLDTSFEKYLSKFKAKQRYNLKRAIRTVEENAAGSPWFVEYRTPAELAAFRPLAQELSSKSTRDLTQAGLPPGDKSWNALFEEAAADRVRAYLVFANGKAAAYGIARARASGLVFWKTGFDPEFRSLSPGMVLLLQMFERFMDAREYQYFDFGPMPLDYKRWLATNSVECANIIYFKKSLIPAAWLAAHVTVTQSSEVGGRLLDRFGIRQRIKRLLRS